MHRERLVRGRGPSTKHSVAANTSRWRATPRVPSIGAVLAADEITAIETWFVQRGLPHFVERRDTATTIWARALPLLVAAYLLLGLNALDIYGYSLAENLGVGAFVLVVAVVTWIVANLLRRRPAFDRPHDIGPARARRVHRRPGDPVARARPVGRRAADAPVRDRAARPALVRHQLRRADAARLGLAADERAAGPAPERPRPRPAAAAAVHDVPVHQRRVLAGRRHARTVRCTSPCWACSSSSGRRSC